MRMKKLSYVTIFIVALGLIVFAQLNWTEYGGNPIFGQGAGGPKAYYPSVLYDTGEFSGHGVSAKYKMWYGTSGSATGLATSDDGINWTDKGVVMGYGYHATTEYYPDGFAGVNSGGSPSSTIMYYRMWYWDVASNLYSVQAIGYAESPDGGNWHNYQPCQNSTVPIVTGVYPEWNRGSYGPCDILYNPTASNTGTDWTFTMYYDGTTGGTEAIGLGFSSDGIIWTGYDADSDGKADPVLDGTYVSGDWDYNYVSRATIIKNADDDYEMWYSGGTGTMNHGIGYATSPDGINWTRDPNNQIFHKSDGNGWRNNRTYCPSVIKDGNSCKMWFTGKSSEGNYAIGYATAAPPECITPPSGMVSWWPGDETMGTATEDIVDANDGTLIGGATFASGKVGQAFSLDGSGYVVIPNDSSLMPEQFTLDAWVKPVALRTNSWDSIISHGASGTDSHMGCCLDSYWLGFYKGKPTFHTAHVGVSGDKRLSGLNLVTLNEWHHIAGSFDGNTKKLYLDGNLVASIEIAYPIAYEEVPVLIGEDINNNSPAGLKFRGLIDEVEIFDRALLASEIQAIYNAGSAGKFKANQVKIDIKPGSYPNEINLGSHGVISVAILSSACFDAMSVDPALVTLAGAGVAVRGRSNKSMAHEKDVNGDGLVDLVVQVETENLDPFLFQDGYVVLTGVTYGGKTIQGSDEIIIVPDN